MKNIAHIVLNTDDNYAIPTIVTITSLLQNKDTESQYNINVLTRGLSPDNLEKLLSIPNINIIEYTNQFSQKYDGTHKHVSSTDLSKFYFPQIFFNFDKILYIDSDMIIQKDLVGFYNTNIDNVYAAVVLDYQAELKNNHLRIGNKRYFNNGMMLLNLAKMRKDDISKKLIISKLEDTRTAFMTQDAFNCVFKDDVIYVSPTYNYMGPNIEKYSFDDIKNFFNLTQAELEDISQNAHIIHLTNKLKPWNSPDTWRAEFWHKYHKLSNQQKNKESMNE